MKVIEFLGMPRSGKTTQIYKLKANLQAKGYQVAHITDRIRARNTKTPPSNGLAYTLAFATQVLEAYYENLTKADYLLVDRGFNDVAVWADVRQECDNLSPDQAKALKTIFQPLTKLVDQTFCFMVPVDMTINRHQGRQHDIVDDVAMNEKWLKCLYVAYKNNMGSFVNLTQIDGTQDESYNEKTINSLIE
ncbi:AAA family ATPase [Patescibacteria group bacterium]